MVKLMSSSSYQFKFILSARSAQVMEVEALDNAENDGTSKDDLEYLSKGNSKNIFTARNAKLISQNSELAKERKRSEATFAVKTIHTIPRPLPQTPTRKSYSPPKSSRWSRPTSFAQKNSQVQRQQRNQGLLLLQTYYNFVRTI